MTQENMLAYRLVSQYLQGEATTLQAPDLFCLQLDKTKASQAMRAAAKAMRDEKLLYPMGDYPVLRTLSARLASGEEDAKVLEFVQCFIQTPAYRIVGDQDAFCQKSIALAHTMGIALQDAIEQHKQTQSQVNPTEEMDILDAILEQCAPSATTTPSPQLSAITAALPPQKQIPPSEITV